MVEHNNDIVIKESGVGRSKRHVYRGLDSALVWHLHKGGDRELTKNIGQRANKISKLCDKSIKTTVTIG